MTDDNISRRNFLGTTAAGATIGSTAFAAPAPASAAKANQRLRIGFIGPGRRGFGAHVKSLLALRKLGANVDLVAVNDVYTVHRDRAVAAIKSETGVEPRVFGNYRDMLQDDSVDAVCIATPDHWHARQTIDALNAKKHVYCEKPMSHTIDESRAGIAAWRRSGHHCGTWRSTMRRPRRSSAAPRD